MTASNPFPLEAIDASGSEIRQILDAVYGSGGWATGSTGIPTIANGGYGVIGDSFKVTGSGASVSVAAGVAVVKGTEAAAQHGYVVGNDASVTLGSIPTAATFRYDLVSVQVRDAQYSGSNNDAPIARTQGTASSTPVDPTPPTSSVILARLRVNNTGVYQIDDLRPRATAQGGQVVCTSTTRPTWAQVGQKIYETDTGNHLAYYGSTTGWRKPWNMPWGVIASAITTSGSSAFNSTTPVPLATTPVSLVKDRRYRIIGRVPATFVSVASANAVIALFVGVDTLSLSQGYYQVSSFAGVGNYGGGSAEHVLTATATGTYQAAMSGALAYVSTSLYCQCATSFPLSIEVVDLGPVAAPA